MTKQSLGSYLEAAETCENDHADCWAKSCLVSGLVVGFTIRELDDDSVRHKYILHPFCENELPLAP
jgi:hypothetical protein